MKRTLPVLLGLVALLAFPPQGVVADGSGESLLERLSAETAALTAKADAHTAVFASGARRMVGVLVGDPARFVAALDDVPEHGDAPKQGKIAFADESVVEATLLDADGELGLAVYSLAGARRTGLPLAGAAALKRGALVVAGGGDLGLHVLGAPGGPLDDIDLPEATGTMVLAPGGGLLGLRGSWAPLRGTDAASCLACHNAGGVSGETLRSSPWVLALRLDAARKATIERRVGPDLNRVGGNVTEDQWLASGLQGQQPQPRYLIDTATPSFLGHSSGDTWNGLVPAAVIERALADVSPEGGRFRRSYLGVVVDERLERQTYDVIDAQGRPLLRYAPGAGDFVTTGNKAYWLPRNGLGGLGGMGQIPLRSAVRLSSVLPDSPAAKAGLKAGNEITALDGRGFAGARGFSRALARRRPGEQVRLTVKDVAEPVNVTLADREQDGRDLASATTVGLTVQALTPDLIAFFELPADSKGVVVRNVYEGSPAAAVPIQRGDVLLTDGEGAPIRDAGELDAILGAAKGKVLLMGRRGQQNAVFQITLPAKVTPRKAR